MRLRFRVKHTALIHPDIDDKAFIATIDIDQDSLSPEERNLIEIRMVSIDVYPLEVVEYFTHRIDENNAESEVISGTDFRVGNTGLITGAQQLEAEFPTFESLMEAIRKDESKILYEIIRREKGRGGL